MTLNEANEGDWLIIKEVKGNDISCQALRLGIGEGERVQLRKKIGGGPVILAKNQLEIAVGQDLALSIHVSSINSHDV